MTVNFGILQPVGSKATAISGGSASAPGTRANPVQDPLKDLVDGYLNAKSKTTENQIQQQTLQQQTMKTAEMQSKDSAAEQLSQAAMTSMSNYRQVLYSQDPVLGVDFDTKIASLQKENALAKQADSISYIDLVKGQGTFWGQVAQGQNDQQREQIFNQLYPNLPDSVKKTIPEQYSPNALMAGMTIHQMDVANHLADNPQKDQTPLEKAQDGVNRAQQALDAANKAGDPVAIQNAQQALDQSKQYVNGEVNGKGIMGSISAPLSALGNAATGALGSLGNFVSGATNPQQAPPTQQQMPGQQPQQVMPTGAMPPPSGMQQPGQAPVQQAPQVPQQLSQAPAGMTPDNSIPNIPAAPNAGQIQQSMTQNAPQVGQLMMDANGNKATFLGGDASDPKNWHPLQ